MTPKQLAYQIRRSLAVQERRHAAISALTHAVGTGPLAAYAGRFARSRAILAEPQTVAGRIAQAAGFRAKVARQSPSYIGKQARENLNARLEATDAYREAGLSVDQQARFKAALKAISNRRVSAQALGIAWETGAGDKFHSAIDRLGGNYKPPDDDEINAALDDLEAVANTVEAARTAYAPSKVGRIR